MRWLALLSAAACLGAPCALAEGASGFGQAEDQIPPYHTHEDRRHGHDHVYPDRGAIMRDVPRGAMVVNYAGVSYRFAGGVWLEPRGPAYVVVAPPIGLLVPALPGFATVVRENGTPYLYANDVYYRARPDLGGYEVVNDPQDAAPAAAKAHESAAPSDEGPTREGAASRSDATSVPAAAVPAGAVPAGAVPAAAVPATTAPATAVTGPSSGSGTSPSGAAPVSADPTQKSAARSTASASPSATSASPSLASATANPTRVSVLPQNGQSADEQARDRYACYRFAVGQSGFDPLAAPGAAGPVDLAKQRSEYERAQSACLQDRGYRLR